MRVFVPGGKPERTARKPWPNKIFLLPMGRTTTLETWRL